MFGPMFFVLKYVFCPKIFCALGKDDTGERGPCYKMSAFHFRSKEWPVEAIYRLDGVRCAP